MSLCFDSQHTCKFKLSFDSDVLFLGGSSSTFFFMSNHFKAFGLAACSQSTCINLTEVSALDTHRYPNHINAFVAQLFPNL